MDLENGISTKEQMQIKEQLDQLRRDINSHKLSDNHLSDDETASIKKQLKELVIKVEKETWDNHHKIYNEVIAIAWDVKSHREKQKKWEKVEKKAPLTKIITPEKPGVKINVDSKTDKTVPIMKKNGEKDIITPQVQKSVEKETPKTYSKIIETTPIMSKNVSEEAVTPKKEWTIENTERFLSPNDERELSRVSWNYKNSLHIKDPDKYNRTIEWRFNDHIKFIENELKKQDFYFIDIGPWIWDWQYQDKTTAKDMPGITSLEMAKSFPEAHIIALDLQESIDILNSKRNDNREIGKNILNQTNVQIMSGDGMNSLKQQLEIGKNDSPQTDMNGKKINIPKPTDTIVIRACNSIDIYYDWEDKDKPLKPVIQQMWTDFKDHEVILFFEKKILKKEKWSTFFEIIGDVSDRWFNHNQQTTKHVKEGTPNYTLRKGKNVQIDTKNQQSENPDMISLLKKIEITDISETAQLLWEKIKKFSGEEKEILKKCTQKMRILSDDERIALIDKFKFWTWDNYSMFVNIHPDVQKAFLVNKYWIPLLEFTISSGRYNTTPTGDFGLPYDNRTRELRNFWRVYRHQDMQGMLDWDTGPQMTTAIIPIGISWKNIYFHWTNKEHELWTNKSAGCIRLDNISMAFLSILTQKTIVDKAMIVNQA